MAQQSTQTCPDDALRSIVAAAQSGSSRVLTDLERLLVQYPEDARLHFLQGSFLAGAQDFNAAKIAMQRAVELAPDYAIARFQFGLLQLTSGDAAAADHTWQRLDALPPRHSLRLFASGLRHLARDEWQECVRDLEDGIARNTENLPLNRDMAMVIAEVRGRSDQPAAPPSSASSVGMLLQQAALKATKH